METTTRTTINLDTGVEYQIVMPAAKVVRQVISQTLFYYAP